MTIYIDRYLASEIMAIYGDMGEMIIEDGIVHTYPHSDFSAEGIEKGFGDIFEATKDMERWLLFEHPRDDAGLTTQSLDCLMLQYQSLESRGCIGLAVEIRSVFLSIIKHHLPENLNIPFLISKDKKELERFVAGVRRI